MSWPVVKISDITHKVTDGSHNPPKGIQSGEYLMLSSKNIFDDEINYESPRYINEEDFVRENRRTDVSVGDVLLTIVGTVGRVAVVSKTHRSFTLQRSVAVIKPDFNKVNSRFLMYQFRSMTKRLTLDARGVAQKGIYLKQIKELEIPLPPLEIQKQIASVLDKADQLRKDCQQMEQELNSLAQSVFIDMFGDPVTNPKGWGHVPFSQVANSIDSGWSPKCKDQASGNDTWGILKLSAVTGGEFKPEENKEILDEHEPKAEIEVQQGDLLFSRKNTYDLVGECAYIFDVTSKLMLPDLIFRLRVNDSLKLYIWGLFNSSPFRQKIKKLASGAAGSMPNISKARLNDLQIPLPACHVLKDYDTFIKKQREEIIYNRNMLNESELAFEALMQKAFKGELNLKPQAA